MRIGIAGVHGRMGRMLVAALAERGLPLAGATARAPGALDGVPVTVAPDPAGLDVLIDFTAPAATAAHAGLAAEHGLALVVGTTGLGAAEQAALDRAAAAAPVVEAGNFSLGVNLLAGLTRRVAAALPGFDVEIVEMHHRHKVDAPSGTALMLGHAAAEGRGTTLEAARLAARDGHTGPRPEGIGFAALRGGDVVGEHDVVFAGPGERVVLRHLATDRMIFARGAVAAALWTEGRPPGRYGMADVLGL